MPRAPCTFKQRDLQVAVAALEQQTGRKVARVTITRAGDIALELEMASVGPADPAPAADDDPWQPGKGNSGSCRRIPNRARNSACWG